MPLTFEPHNAFRRIYPYAWWDGYFTDEELDKILDMYSGVTLEKAVLSDDKITPDLRKSNIKFDTPTEENNWIFERLAQATMFLNDRYFQFDLLGFSFYQYTVYDTAGSKYDWHPDIWYGDTGPKEDFLTRKISLILILSDPSEYEGGKLELYNGTNAIVEIDQKRGRIVAFPSWQIHRVTPIISGIRKSLVTWVQGPKWK
jgi:PKHD-type hydroxylase